MNSRDKAMRLAGYEVLDKLEAATVRAYTMPKSILRIRRNTAVFIFWRGIALDRMIWGKN